MPRQCHGSWRTVAAHGIATATRHGTTPRQLHGDAMARATKYTWHKRERTKWCLFDTHLQYTVPLRRGIGTGYCGITGPPGNTMS